MYHIISRESAAPKRDMYLKKKESHTCVLVYSTAHTAHSHTAHTTQHTAHRTPHTHSAHTQRTNAEQYAEADSSLLSSSLLCTIG